MYYIGVSKRFSNPTKRVTNTRRLSKYEVVYYYDENMAFKCKKLSKLQYYMFKWFKKPYKKKECYCEICKGFFISLVKNEKQTVVCPYCEE